MVFSFPLKFCLGSITRVGCQVQRVDALFGRTQFFVFSLYEGVAVIAAGT